MNLRWPWSKRTTLAHAEREAIHRQWVRQQAEYARAKRHRRTVRDIEHELQSALHAELRAEIGMGR